MDVNLTLVSGRLALRPELERLPDGSQRARLLVVARPQRRGRFDVLPVVVPAELTTSELLTATSGSRVFVAGSLMRRCSMDPWDSPGRIELIADAVGCPDLEDAERALSCTPFRTSDGRLAGRPDVEDGDRPR